MKIIKVRTIVDGHVRGKVLVSKASISFLGGVDGKTGTIIDPENELYKLSIKNKILVFPEGIGSTVGSYVIYALKVNNVAPLAMIVNYAETILIAGAILANIPLVDKPSLDLLSLVKNNDTIEIDTKNNLIKVF